MTAGKGKGRRPEPGDGPTYPQEGTPTTSSVPGADTRPVGVESALALAAKGYRVLPLSPGTGTPAIKDWPAKATSDADAVRRMWHGRADYGVGLAMGDGPVALDLDVKHGKAGIDAWTCWAADHGVDWAPAQGTPSGGQHVLYLATERYANSADTVLPGVDIRSKGGYVRAYTTDLPAVPDLPEMPEAVGVLLRRELPKATNTAANRPIGRAGVETALSNELFELAAWPEGSRNNRLNLAAYNIGQLVGPFLDEDTAREALTNAALASGLPADEVSGTVDSGLTSGMANPRPMAEDEAVPPAADLQVVDLRALIDGLRSGAIERPKPTIGGLLYPGRVNGMFGTHTAGKTWSSLFLSRDVKTLYLDYEDTGVTMAERVMTFDEDLAESLLYCSVSGPLDVGQVVRTVQSHDVKLVVMDSTGEALSAAGLDSNSEKDVTKWFAEVPDKIAESGPAVLLLDHVAKTSGSATAVGSFRKAAAITGAQYHLDSGVGFSRERAGWSRLTCAKDRSGYFASGETVGRIKFTPLPEDGRLLIDLERGGPDALAITDRIERDVLDYVYRTYAEMDGTVDEDGKVVDPRQNPTAIRAAVKGDNKLITAALNHLTELGALHCDVIGSSTKTTGGKHVGRRLYSPGHTEFSVVRDGDEDAL